MVLLIIPKTLLALLHAATHCCELFISLDIIIPKSFSIKTLSFRKFLKCHLLTSFCEFKLQIIMGGATGTDSTAAAGAEAAGPLLSKVPQKGFAYIQAYRRYQSRRSSKPKVHSENKKIRGTRVCSIAEIL